jgi:hypothetical protein
MRLGTEFCFACRSSWKGVLDCWGSAACDWYEHIFIPGTERLDRLSLFVGMSV